MNSNNQLYICSNSKLCCVYCVHKEPHRLLSECNTIHCNRNNYIYKNLYCDCIQYFEFDDGLFKI